MQVLVRRGDPGTPGYPERAWLLLAGIPGSVKTPGNLFYAGIVPKE